MKSLQLPRNARPSRFGVALLIFITAVGCMSHVSDAANAVAPRSILFIGNSFTYGHGSAVRFYRSDTVTDLNKSGIGGVPALFKSFTEQARLSFDVFLETHPGVGLDWHLDNARSIIDQRPWDLAVLQSFSTLDAKKPGDPALLVSSIRKLAALLRAKNPSVELRLTSTWPRADLTYEPHGVYYGEDDRSDGSRCAYRV